MIRHWLQSNIRGLEWQLDIKPLDLLGSLLQDWLQIWWVSDHKPAQKKKRPFFKHIKFHIEVNNPPHFLFSRFHVPNDSVPPSKWSATWFESSRSFWQEDVCIMHERHSEGWGDQKQVQDLWLIHALLLSAGCKRILRVFLHLRHSFAVWGRTCSMGVWFVHVYVHLGRAPAPHPVPKGQQTNPNRTDDLWSLDNFWVFQTRIFNFIMDRFWLAMIFRDIFTVH